jgi:NADPH-dependent 2,4-dienoyl-CoA reductase/sulfur reductase-like enzyme
MRLLGEDCLSLVVLLAVVRSASAAPASCSVNGRKYDIDTVITKDIAIIGGGSAGTYSAIRLRDLGKSIVVIEGTDRLGGHARTYIEPNTATPIDYFQRLNVPYDVLGLEGVPGVTNK